MHKLINFEFLGDYKMRLFFDNGFNAQIDFELFLQKGFARELLKKENFEQAYIESGGGLSWNNGFDFCTNFLYETSFKQKVEHA